MIRVSSAYLGFDHDGTHNEVLQDISFSVEPSESCSIIGPSGCGKTSLLFLLAGLLHPDSGSLSIAGTRRTATILQNFGLFPWKTVYQNIALGLTLRGEPGAKIHARVDTLLEDMGLLGFGSHFPGQLSGGMQQRVALARALAVDPEILLMDEPLSSLDALTRERLQNLILTLWQDKKLTVVLVTHSIEEALFLGRKVIVLSGRPARILEIFENSEAGEASYRQSELFFRRCTELRELLKGEDDGRQA